MLIAKFRRIAFWIFDWICGGEIRKHYLDTVRIISSGNNNSTQLSKLLHHAVSTTSFYSCYDPNDFSSFPVLNKNELKSRIDEISSQCFIDDRLYETSTSGSTGIPLRIKWNPQKRARQQAELVYFYERANHPLGERFVFFRENQNKRTRSKLQQFLRGMYDYDVTSFNDDDLDKVYHTLTRWPFVRCYIAYGSFHEAFTKYLRTKNPPISSFRLKSIVTSSEVLSNELKTELYERTGAEVYDRYSNEENGFIAQTENCSDVFWVNTAGFKLEVLKIDSDAPAEIGEIGRIVITDLYNFAVPLIRYDTGDLTTKIEERNGWTTKIRIIHGRVSDVIYDTKGARMTTSVWNAYMGDFINIKQYQFIQQGPREYTLRVNVYPGIYTDQQFVDAIKKAVGNDANILIEHVNEVPVLSSGKFKKTICNYTYSANDYI